MRAFDDLELLRLFVAIVESGSISAAARRVSMTQPTLSRNLRTLEDRCGCDLLHRDTHRMQLSLAGHQMLADAKSILAMAEESAQRLRTDRTSLSGHLRLFATIDFGQHVVTRLIGSFCQANPAVTAELFYSNRPVHMIEEGCDSGIIAGEIRDESLIARSLGQIRRYPVASPEFLRRFPRPERPKDIKEWPWITLSGLQFDSGKNVTLLGKNEATQTFPIRPVLQTEGVTSIREAARMGLGIGVLPEWLIGDDIVAGRLV
jgi:DNA-binding transcriptional LysR family regulator